MSKAQEILDFLLVNTTEVEGIDLSIVSVDTEEIEQIISDTSVQDVANIDASPSEYNFLVFPGYHTIKNYPGPITSKYSNLHPKSKELFRKADQIYWKATNGKHLSIESGFRDVYEQADLYRCWRLGLPKCNPANIPGASIHNYGLAIDIRNARDSQVIEALDKNGWDRTAMPREPWHWEPVGTSEHNAAVKKQSTMKAKGSIARKWQNTWEKARQRNDERNIKVDNFDRRYQIWQPQWEQLRLEVEAFETLVNQHNKRVQDFKQDLIAFNDRVGRYNAEVIELKRLLEQIQNMEPGEKRNRLILDYNNRGRAAQAESRAIDQQRAQIDQRHNQLSIEKQDLEKRNKALSGRSATLIAEMQVLVGLKDVIDTMEREIKSLMLEQKRLLDEIAKQVHP